MPVEFLRILWKLRNHQMLRLIKHSLVYGIGNITRRFLSIFLLPIYTRYLTPADYGITALLGILGMIVGTVTMCGLTNGIGRYFYYTEQDKTTLSEVVWSPFVFVCLLSIFVLAPMAMASGVVSRVLFGSDQYSYLVILSLIGILMSNLAGVGSSILVFQEKAMTVNFINIARVLVGVVSGLFFVAYLKRGVTGVVEASLTTSMVMFLPILRLTMFRFKPEFSLSVLKKELRFSLPLVGAVFAFFFIDSSDRYILKIFLPLSEIGLYNMGYNLGLAMMIIVSGFTLAWPPYYHKHNQNNEGQSICSGVMRMYLLGTSVCVVALSMASPLAFKLLTTEKFHQAFTVVPWVAMAYMLKGPYIIFLMGVLVKNKTSWQLYLEGTAAAVNILGNVALIPVIGREAAALTTLISYGIMVLGSYFMVMRINPIPQFSARYVWGVIALTFIVPGNAVWIGKLPGYGYALSAIVLTLVFLGVLISASYKEFAFLLREKLPSV